MNSVVKGTKIFLGVTVGACIVSDNFARRVDRNLVAPIRNYKYTLENPRYWRTSEELTSFRKELASGVGRMLKGE